MLRNLFKAGAVALLPALAAGVLAAQEVREPSSEEDIRAALFGATRLPSTPSDQSLMYSVAVLINFHPQK